MGTKQKLNAKFVCDCENVITIPRGRKAPQCLKCYNMQWIEDVE